MDNMPEINRSFESRLLFIKDIFANKYEPIDIMASSVQYKLGMSLLQYREDLHTSALSLQYNKAMKVLNKMNKEFKDD